MMPMAAHAEIKLDLGGYFKGYGGYAHQDVSGTKEGDFKRKAQVFFIGETTLDNGLTVGYNGQLIQDTSVDPGTGQDAKVEQSYLYFSGNWGRMNLGRENGAAYLLQVPLRAPIPTLTVWMSRFRSLTRAQPISVRITARQVLRRLPAHVAKTSSIQTKFTYLTPKFNGFQAGISYAPTVRAADTNSYFGMPSNATVGGYEDLLDGGLRYDGEFSGVGVHAGAGYTTASLQTPIIAGQGDYKEWNAGLKLTFEGFGVGGAYNNRNGGLDAAGLGDVDTWIGGVDYTYGAYNFGASYLNSKGDALLGGQDKFNRFMLGAGYTFGPGMKFNGSVGFDDLNAAAAANDNKATVLAIVQTFSSN